MVGKWRAFSAGFGKIVARMAVPPKKTKRRRLRPTNRAIPRIKRNNRRHFSESELAEERVEDPPRELKFVGRIFHQCNTEACQDPAQSW